MTPNMSMAATQILKGKKGFIPRPAAGMRRYRANYVDSSEESDAEENTVTPSKKQQKKIPDILEITSGSDGDSDADIPAKVTKRTGRKTQILPPGRSTRNTASRSQPKAIELSNTSDDDLALPPTRSIQTRKGLFQSKQAPQSSPLSKMAADENEDEDEDDDLIISSPRRSQKLVFRKDKDSDDEDEDDIKSSARQRPRPSIRIHPEDEDEEEEDIVSPLKRRRVMVESDSDIVESPSKRQRSSQTAEVSDSDLPTPSKSRHRSKSETPTHFTRQSRGRRHRTEKEKKMELLRRKRAGEKISQVTDTEGSDSEDDDDEPEFEKLEEFDDDDEEEEEIPKPKRKTKQTSNTNEDSDEDDFIVDDDDDDPLGVPSAMSMPLEFTQAAHKPLKQHFKDAVEWMVHNKINPAFARDDQVYQIAFKKLEVEATGLAKSKFASTQWTRDFTVALYSRPDFITGPLEPGEGYDLETGKPKCDACNHRSHVPSAFIQFQGKPYDKKTLEELDQGSDDSDEEEEEDDPDRIEVNDEGQELPSENIKWFVGNVCYANAEQTHTLVHWKFALYEWVKGNLEAEGELLPEKLAEREKLKAKKRTAYANAIVDRWETDDQLHGLWRDFKNQISTARELKPGKRGRWV